MHRKRYIQSGHVILDHKNICTAYLAYPILSAMWMGVGISHDGLALFGFQLPSSVCQEQLEARARARNWLHIAAQRLDTAAFHEDLAVVLANHGAPSWLVSAAWQAGEDDRHHASLALELSDLIDSSFGPEPRLSRFEREAELDELVVAEELARGRMPFVGAEPCVLLDEVIHGACVAHTLAAFELELLATRARDSDLSWVLGRLALDLAKHAELAWSVCRWMLRRWPALRDHARASFEAAKGRPPAGLHGLLPRLGLMGSQERRALLERGHRELVGTTAARLVKGPASARHVETWLEARRRPISADELPSR